MRLYKLTGATDVPGGVRFAASQEAATQVRMAMMTELGLLRKSVSIEEVDCPTDKNGLIGFLNALYK